MMYDVCLNYATISFHLFGFHTEFFPNLQTNVMYYKGISHALRTISRDEGILGLYKGLGATLLVCLSVTFSSIDQEEMI